MKQYRVDFNSLESIAHDDNDKTQGIHAFNRPGNYSETALLLPSIKGCVM